MTWLLTSGSYSNTRILCSLSDEQAAALAGLPIWPVDDDADMPWDTDARYVSCGDDLTLVRVPHVDSGLTLVESTPERRCWVRGWWNGVLQRDLRQTIRWARVEGLPDPEDGGDRRGPVATSIVMHPFEEDYTLGVELYANGWPCEVVDAACDKFLDEWRANPAEMVAGVWLNSTKQIPFTERAENEGIRAVLKAKGWR